MTLCLRLLTGWAKVARSKGFRNFINPFFASNWIERTFVRFEFRVLNVIFWPLYASIVVAGDNADFLIGTIRQLNFWRRGIFAFRLFLLFFMKVYSNYYFVMRDGELYSLWNEFKKYFFPMNKLLLSRLLVQI